MDNRNTGSGQAIYRSADVTDFVTAVLANYYHKHGISECMARLNQTLDSESRKWIAQVLADVNAGQKRQE